MLELAWDTKPDHCRTDHDLLARVRDLEHSLERLTLTSAALWSLLRQRTGLTDQDLLLRLRRLEVEHQHAPARSPQCGKCGRSTSPRKSHCVYCGEQLETLARA